MHPKMNCVHDMWIPHLSRIEGPLHQALVNALATAIYKGELRPGTQLPTHRRLADLLGVNVSTVTRAYREAARRHLIGGEIGRGTYVLGHADSVNLFALLDRDNRQLIDLSVNTPVYPQPDSDLEHILVELQSRTMTSRLLQYQTPDDWRVHRAAAAQWLALRGLQRPDPAHIVLCCGAQHAVSCALTSLCSRGDTVLVENYTSPGMHALARQLGLHLHALPMDNAGVRPDGLESALQSGLSKVAVLMPSLQNPTSIIMPLARRHAIADVLKRCDGIAIEDDAYGLLPSEFIPPLAALAPRHVHYATSLSKSVAPGLRLGFLYTPTATQQALVDQFHTTSWLVNPLMAQIGTEWIHKGTAERRLTWQRKELQRRQRLLAQVLPSGSWTPSPESPHAWMRLPADQDATAFCDRARREGLVLTPASFFAANRKQENRHVRLCVGAASSLGTLKSALQTLQSLLINSD